ncbi:MAG: bifunctional methylenetetrahydrofolate dehydrogenase/methenyltetrahydrofolate cyclohydrolase FolD [Candidatus Limiplasma sp.]|nr:bifunctional methylenetetrahydrofolate dehydrogenase/methenyltetrahydrofolate cyclohydrolase FolD [Candidatus Limiplasma sp.]
MAAKLLDGKLIAAQVEEALTQRIAALAKQGTVPGLTVILVGDDPASQTYVRNKEKACARLGIRSQTLRLPADASQQELEAAIVRANQDEAVHGILVQLPLPGHLDAEHALALICPEKDVDGFHEVNLGRLMRGTADVVACTPKGVMRMLDSAGIDPAGKNAVVVGRSLIVGKPMALLLLARDATVTVCHSHTRHLADITRQADLLVAAVGKPRVITADMVRDGAVVVDVGINRVDGKLCGDVDFDAVAQKASYISPVPGGVGKMTIAMLMENTVLAAEKAVRA